MYFLALSMTTSANRNKSKDAEQKIDAMKKNCLGTIQFFSMRSNVTSRSTKSVSFNESSL